MVINQVERIFLRMGSIEIPSNKEYLSLGKENDILSSSFNIFV